MATAISSEQGNVMDLTWLKDSKIRNLFNDLSQKLSKNWNDKSVIIISVIAIIAVSFSFFIIGYGARMLCELFGLGYPLYITLNVLEEGKISEARPLIIYWVVFGVLQSIQWLPDITLGYFFWYWILKACFLLWCVGYERKFIGAQYIYQEIIMPIYQKKYNSIRDIEGVWDNVISKVKRALPLRQTEPEGKMKETIHPMNTNKSANHPNPYVSTSNKIKDTPSTTTP